MKWEGCPFFTGCGEGENKEASKDPAAPGEGVLALGPLAGHQGPKGAGWPHGAGGQSP